MSGIYLLTVLGAWVALTWLLIRVWRHWRASAGASRFTVDAVFLVITLTWTLGSLWFGGGRIIYYDSVVDRLCREDGGVKVYETVTLPVERFDKFGNVRVPEKKHARSDDKYYYERDYFDFRDANPKVTRVRHRVVRRDDERVLGESVRYTRGGGELPGPWHGSSFICPPVEKDRVGLERLIFRTGETK